MEPTEFTYFTGEEAEYYKFYRIPKQLFTDARFKGLSLHAKILYGVLLDRMSLSIRNGWIDNDNRVFIYYTIEEVSEMLGVGRDKAMRIFAELDNRSGCGLIRKKLQGLGKPARIYVMNIGVEDTYGKPVENPPSEGVENSTSKAQPTSRPTENPTSGGRKSRLQEVVNCDSNNTDNNKTDRVIRKEIDTDYYKRLNLCRELTRDILNGTYEQNKDKYIELKT